MVRLFGNIHIIRLDRKFGTRSNLNGKYGYVRIVVPTSVHLLLKLYARERGIPL